MNHDFDGLPLGCLRPDVAHRFCFPLGARVLFHCRVGDFPDEHGDGVRVEWARLVAKQVYGQCVGLDALMPFMSATNDGDAILGTFASPDAFAALAVSVVHPFVHCLEPDDRTKAQVFTILSRSVFEFRSLLRKKIALWQKWAIELEVHEAELKESLDVGPRAILKDCNLLLLE
eukprot:6467737-Amphidinium_carterae.1